MNKEVCNLSDESCCEQSCCCSQQPLEKMVYVVGHNLDEYSKKKWELIGIFDYEQEAINVCENDDYWVYKTYMGLCSDEEEPCYMYPTIKREWKYRDDE